MGPTLESVIKTISSTVYHAAPLIDKAKAIYDWMTKNIAYDLERKRAIDNHLDDGIPYEPEITIERRKGICSDQALLYVELARKMKIKAYYAHVDVDYKGARVAHACAIIRVPEGEIQVDPAYQMFNSKHKQYCIIEPKRKTVDRIIIEPKQKASFLKPIFAAASILSGIAACVINISCNGEKEIRMIAAENEVRFYSANGQFVFSYNQEAQEAMKEYLFLVESMQGRLEDKEMFKHFISIDTNKNSKIDINEATEARENARAHYLKRN
ncbi:MAG: transglutaminase-like domain-containing protein [Candidatus Woesearchaeota archaeon]